MISVQHWTAPPWKKEEIKFDIKYGITEVSTLPFGSFSLGPFFCNFGFAFLIHTYNIVEMKVVTQCIIFFVIITGRFSRYSSTPPDLLEACFLCNRFVLFLGRMEQMVLLFAFGPAFSWLLPLFKSQFPFIYLLEERFINRHSGLVCWTHCFHSPKQ